MPEFCIAMLTLGVILLLVGLIGKVKAKEIEVGTNNKVVRVIVGALGTVFVGMSILLINPVDRQFQKDTSHQSSDPLNSRNKMSPVSSSSTGPNKDSFVMEEGTIISRFDFNQPSSYRVGTICGQPLGSQYQWQCQDEEDRTLFKIRNSLLEVAVQERTGRWLHVPLPAMYGKIQVLWTARYIGPPNKQTNVGFCFSDLSSQNKVQGKFQFEYSQQGAIVRFANTGIIEAINGDLKGDGTYNAATRLLYTDGKNLKFRMVIDIVDQTFDLFITSNDGQEIMLAKDYIFRFASLSYPRKIDALLIWSSAYPRDGYPKKSVEGTSVFVDEMTIMTIN